MSEIKIFLKDDIFVSKKPNIISTTFYLKIDDICFPDKQWVDFTYPLLEIWKSSLTKNRDLSHVKFELPFMDGPYRLDVTKDDRMQLSIECVNFRKEEIAEYIFDCSYFDFLSELNSAIKTFSYILYSCNMHSGTFAPAYAQTLSSIKELKDDLTILRNQ